MDERMRFVIRLKDGESMASLCREFQISRKTGYKFLERSEQCGVEGLSALDNQPQEALLFGRNLLVMSIKLIASSTGAAALTRFHSSRPDSSRLTVRRSATGR